MADAALLRIRLIPLREPLDWLRPRCPELHAQICDEWPDPIAACSGVVSLGRFEGILRLWVELNREVAQEYATLVCHNSDKGAADENPTRVQPRFGPRQMT